MKRCVNNLLSWGLVLTAALSAWVGPSASGAPLAFADDPFTIAVIPDTQIFSVFEGWADANFTPMTRYIAEAQGPRNIVFATHVGDVTQGELSGFGPLDDLIASHPQQFANAERAMSILGTPDAARMPYSVAIGNHDYRETGNKNSSTADFRAAFGPQRYEPFDWYVGSYQVTGDADRSGLSHYQHFTGGGIEFLHLNLEFDPTPDVLGWADQVIDRHPSLPVIVSTHSYLNDPDENGQGAGRNGTGQRVWDDLIRENPQVFMVLAGHEHNGIDGQNGEYHQVSLNDDGLEVFEVLANYQDYFTAGFFPDLADGGEGWMRLMEFDLAAGEIGVQTYFPAEDRFQTDADSAFTLEVDFGRRFFFVPEPSTAGLLLLSSSCLLRRLPRGHDLNVRDT